MFGKDGKREREMHRQADQGIANANAGMSSARRWLRRLVSAGLVFFLVKGLLWLSLPGILLWWGSGS